MMGGWFLSLSIGGKVAGVMTGYWDDFTDKKIYFLVLVIAAFLGGILIYSRLKSLNKIVFDKTGSA
jgi:POT family proton-dependent oligopeptide transporter